ncbi:MAG TPA: protein kinase [Polyangia bacterium]|nr:protein kinase [Polyangia bacterium]
MANAQDYLTGLSQLHRLTSEDDRRAVWRQGLATLAAIATQQPAPLEGLDPEDLVASTRLALMTGLVDDVGFLSKPIAATALFELAAALPQGAERTDLGRRISTALTSGDAVTFAAVTRSLALSAPRALAEPAVQARLALALQLPLGGDAGVDALALALISQADLEQAWLTGPSTGSLAARRLAARVLERAAAEVARKEREGNPVGARAMQLPAVKAAWARLLVDRESLVWRHVATARGLLAATVPAYVEEIERELAPRNGPGEWRRAATSLAARIAHDPSMAERCQEVLASDVCKRDPGMRMAMVYGLARAAEDEPEAASALLERLVQAGDVDVIEAFGEFRRSRAPSELAADVVTGALFRLRGLPPTNDDGLVALREELVDDLLPKADDPKRARTIEELLASALQAFAEGKDPRPRTEAALAAAGRVLAELETNTDATPEARRRSFRCIGQLERGLLDTALLRHLLAVCRPNTGGGPAAANEADPLAALLARLDEWMCKREEPPLPTSDVPHLTFRLRRLRALLHVLDVERGGDDGGGRARAGRMRAFRLLLRRVQGDPPSPLRRITAATLARACDRIARAQMGELSDVLVAVLTRVRKPDDLRVLAEASMVAEVKEIMAAAADLVQLTAGSAAQSLEGSSLEAIATLARVLPLAVSPRVEGLRQTLVQLGQSLRALHRAGSLSALVPDDTGSPLQGLETTATYGARFFAAARARVGLTGGPPAPTVGPAIAAIEAAIETARRDPRDDLNESLGAAIEAATAALRADFPAGIGDAVARALLRLAMLPRERADDAPEHEAARLETAPRLVFPPWMPGSRLLGGFYVQRAISSGAAGSVFVAQRAHERHDDAAESYALKVPSYNGQNSRTLTEQEFLHLFREEAGALLTLKPHPNLAGFVTFDAVARPKPILVMELVSGSSLERVIDRRELSTASTFAILDGIAGGLASMHGQGLGHLDIKPANIIMRPQAAAADLAGDAKPMPVLVDFGLAGRKIRPGCASPHYGAPEIWDPGMYGPTEPMAADVYAFCCLAYELFVGKPLFAADTLPGLIACHFAHDGNPEGLAALHESPALAPLAQIVAAGLVPDPRGRATIGELRDALRDLQPGLAHAAWPVAAAG